MFKKEFIADNVKWVVLTAIPEIVKVEVGQLFTTKQALEVFEEESRAVARLLQIDPSYKLNSLEIIVEEESSEQGDSGFQKEIPLKNN